MQTHHYILATAGHVDHGKSALVKALTGTDPDRLPEEKTRGITIDLGFAHLLLPAPGASEGTYDLGIVDVPGHEDFVKNMVAGVGSIDLALLVVAADDGWMPQTEEHLQILTYLGVRHAIVALTKADLATVPEATLTAQVRGRLQDSPFADAPIVPTSITDGRGIDELRVTLGRVLATLPAPPDSGKPRLSVDRAFSLKGVGTVVTGTLVGGALERGQTVMLQPVGRTSRLRGLQSHNSELDRAVPGMRVALNLADADLRSEVDPRGVARGQIVTTPELGRPHDTLDVRLERSVRLKGLDEPAARPLKDGTLVRVHHGATCTPARIRLREVGTLKPGQSALAELRFGKPVYVFAGDRLVIRDSAEQVTLAGGVVLDPDADRRAWREEAQGELLSLRAAALEDPAVWVGTEMRRRGAASRTGLLVKTRFSADTIETCVARLIESGMLAGQGSLLFDGNWWLAVRQGAIEAIDFEHQAHPERAGLSLAQLRVALKSALVTQGVFEAVVNSLLGAGFVQHGSAIGRKNHRLSLPPHLEAAGSRIRGILLARPLDPPSRKELAPDRTGFEALRFLIQNGEAVALGTDLVLAAGAYSRAVRGVKRCLRQAGQATVSDLRKEVGCTRRLMVPLIEKLDAEGVTRRDGDFRLPGPAFGGSTEAP
ncbi:MAG: selenocysteine-specific translation elongation factor [Verrucomicrobiales bacterium]|nr:selenocysteine-specific translation elongation factor [Verrucomicrobiales bacterium]